MEQIKAIRPKLDRARIDAKAEAAGLSVSAYQRERALGDDQDALNKVDQIIAQMGAALDGVTTELAAVLARLAVTLFFRGRRTCRFPVVIARRVAPWRSTLPAALTLLRRRSHDSGRRVWLHTWLRRLCAERR